MKRRASVLSEPQARGARALFQGLRVGREKATWAACVSMYPPCFMHSVLCDDKRPHGGRNAGLQGPREGGLVVGCAVGWVSVGLTPSEPGYTACSHVHMCA